VSSGVNCGASIAGQSTATGAAATGSGWRYAQPAKTSFPIVFPDSSFACAARRFAALIGASRSRSVPRICFASMS